MEKQIRVLIIEDSEDDTLLLLRELKKGGYQPEYERVDTPSAMDAAIENKKFDIVISDYVMPHFSGIEALKLLKKKDIDIPFILVSGRIGEDSAVDAMKAGAQDYVRKEDLRRLIPAIGRELEEAQARQKHKLALQALRNNEEKYRRIVETANEGIWLIDKNCKTSFLNDRMADMLGFAKEEMAGKSIYSFMEAKERKAAETAAKGHKWGINEDHDIKFLRKDGKIMWASLRTSPLFDENNNYAGALAMVTDITENKHAEEVLINTKSKLQGLIDGIPDMVIFKDVNCTHLIVNKAVEEFTGHKYEDLVGKTNEQILPPDMARECRLSDENAMKSPGITRYEESNIDKNGNMMIFDTIKAPIHDKQGNLMGLVVISRNITELRQASEKLKESEIRFRQLAESLPQLVWTCSPDGKCDYLSRQWIAYTGVPEEEQLGYGWLSQIHPDDRDRVIDGWNEALKKNNDFDIEFRIRRSDGVYRWFKTRAVQICDAQGIIVKWYGSNTDIDDLKQAEKELKEHREHLEELVKDRTAELEKKNAKLEHFNRLFVGRELRMAELKKVIADLEKEVASLKQSIDLKNETI